MMTEMAESGRNDQRTYVEDTSLRLKKTPPVIKHGNGKWPNLWMIFPLTCRYINYIIWVKEE